MIDVVYCQISLLFFNIPLLNDYINLNSSTNCRLSFIYIYIYIIYTYICIYIYIYIYISFNCFRSNLLWFFLSFCNFISNFIINQIISFFGSLFNCCFFFEVVLDVDGCLAWSRSFWPYLLLKFLLIFLPNFPAIFKEKYKIS